MAVVDELVAILGYDLRNEGDLTRWKAGLRSAETQLAALAAAASRYGKIIGAAVGAGAVMLGKSVLKTGMQFEAYDIQLETLLGSQAKAQEALNWISNFAKTTPLEMGDVVEAFVSLKNSGIDPTNGSLQALTDAMAGSGKGTELLGRLTLALGQAWTKQKLQGGEILQLVEAGIPVWDMLSEATGKNVQELQKLSEKGKLGRKEIQLLIDAIGKKYTGASEKFSRSMAGITSNISDNWTQFLKKIADAGFYDAVKERLQGVLDTMNRWADDGTLDKWATRISAAFIAVMNVAEMVFGRIATHGAFFADWLASVDTTTLYAIGAAFGLLLIRVFPTMWALAAIATALDDIFTYLEGGESKFGAFVEWIQEMTGASEGLAQALAAIVASLGLLMVMKPFTVLGGLGKFLKGFAGGVTTETTKGLAGRSGGLLALMGKLSPWLAMLTLSGDSPKRPAGQSWEDDPRALEWKAQDAGNRRRQMEDLTRPPDDGGRSRSLDDFVSGPPRADASGMVNSDAVQKMLAGMDNLNGNLAKMTMGAAAGATITDARQDNRSFPVNVNSSIVQNITEAAAPGAAGAATAAAVGKAATDQASRVTAEPQF